MVQLTKSITAVGLALIFALSGFFLGRFSVSNSTPLSASLTTTTSSSSLALQAFTRHNISFPYTTDKNLESALQMDLSKGGQLTEEQRAIARAFYARIQYALPVCSGLSTLTRDNTTDQLQAMLAGCATSTNDRTTRTKLLLIKDEVNMLVPASVGSGIPLAQVAYADYSCGSVCVGVIFGAVSAISCAMGSVYGCVSFAIDIYNLIVK